MNKGNRKIVIPFDGFYQSITSSFIDDAAECEANWRDEQGEQMYTDCSVDYSAVAVEYVSNYRHWLKSEFDLNINSLQFHSLYMPREYNFCTDEITCTITDREAAILFNHLKQSGQLKKKAADKFTSRDGFHSFYDHFVDECGSMHFAEWHDVEARIIFPEPEDYFQLWESSASNGFFYNIINYKEAEK